MSKEKREYVLLPFTCAIDSREQFPFTFRGLTADADKGKLPLVVPVETRTLRTCDYSIVGHESAIGVERKSKSDFVSTLIQGRDRFIRELERMQEMERTYVVVEACWESIINEPLPHPKVKPKSLYRTVLDWQDEFSKTHWWFCYSRSFAEHTTLRILERYWKNKQKQGVKE